MGFPYIGKNADGWMNDLFQLLHFTTLRNARFKYAQRMCLIHLPDTQRNTYLRIVTFRTSYNSVLIFQQLVQPFFHNCFTVTACDAYHRDSKLSAMPGSKVLQCFQTIFYCYEISSRKPGGGKRFCYNKITYASFIKLCNELVAIPAWAT